MAINSKIKVLRDNLKTQLSARGALSGVDIFKFPPADGAPKTEFIFFVLPSRALATILGPLI